MYLSYIKTSWYIACCLLYGDCPLLGVSVNRGFTVYVYAKMWEGVQLGLGSTRSGSEEGRRCQHGNIPNNQPSQMDGH